VVTALTSSKVSSADRHGMLAPFIFTLRTKGPLGLANRFASVASRFGPTPRTMVRRLDHMVDTAAAMGFLPTCPITTTVLARHPDAARAIADRGMELAIHGLRHNDHMAEDELTQTREIAQAVEVFERHGLHPTGFRAPYLRGDDATRAAVKAAGLGYQSDDAIVFRVPNVDDEAVRADAYQRALTMYDAHDADKVACRPSLVDGLVQIPVCVPDDEMLVDRLHLTDHACGIAWCAILETTHEQGDLFTMQVHPERFIRSARAVMAVLQRAADLPGGVWAARLEEITAWWRARAACRIELGNTVGDRISATVVGDRRARMRLVGGGNDVDRSATRTTTLAGERLPAVGVDADVPKTVVRFLEEDGYLVTTSAADLAGCAVRLTGPIDASDHMALRRRINAAEHPVLALDRWPDDARSALALTGDIDALTIQDFVHRVHENAHGAPAWITGTGAA
jgi:hypothetical protein